MDIAIKHLKHCLITILAVEDIFSVNLGSQKGKMVTHLNPHVKSGVDPVPPDILKVHCPITLTIDIMFINKIAFLIATPCNLHFGTMEAFPN